MNKKTKHIKLKKTGRWYELPEVNGKCYCVFIDQYGKIHIKNKRESIMQIESYGDIVVIEHEVY